jgi:ribosomal-protein-alanine N-acetyltransferase
MVRTAGWPAQLSAGPVLLRPPRLRDSIAWSAVRIRNEQWLARWEPTPTGGTWAERNGPTAWPPLCGALRKAGRAGTMMPFAITYGGAFVGQLNVSNVVWGALRGCTVGYWVDQDVAGRGIVPTALALAIDHVLGPVGLHRVEVDIRPENEASLRVVAKLGLRREGYYERFLDIDGAWRDHIAFAVTSDELAGTTMLARLGSLPVPPG